MTPQPQQSFRDPENYAHEFEERWYRLAGPESAQALRTMLSTGVATRLNEQGLLVGLAAVDGEPAARVRESFRDQSWRAPSVEAEVFEVAGREIITYPWEWPNALLAEAAHATLRVRDALLEVGLDIKDASAMNVQFRGVRPVFIDLGSIEEWRPNPGWNASRQFIEHFINPLAVGASPHVSAAEAWVLSRGRGLPSDQARSLMPHRLRRKAGLALMQATTRPVAGNTPSETRYRDAADVNRDLALRATRALNRRLLKQVQKLSSGQHQTTWSDYGPREHYSQADLNRKSEFVARFITADPSRNGLVLDVGGNDGYTARHLVRETESRVIVLDADAGALDALCSQVDSDDVCRSRITPLWGDMTNMSPAQGLLGGEYRAFLDRIAPTAVVCQAVLHHVVITQGVPMRAAVEALAQFGAPVHVEFATEDDAKVKLLLSQIPNWRGDYSLDAFRAELSRRFATVIEHGTTSDTRVAFSAEGP